MANMVPVSSLYNGPQGAPDAVGPSGGTNDDFTNKSSLIPTATTPGSTIDPQSVGFTNTVINRFSEARSISLTPTPPTPTDLLPANTKVTISYQSSSAVYTYNGTGFIFTSGTGVVAGNPVSATNPIQIASLASNAQATYGVEIDLPSGTPLSTDVNIERGFPVTITAFVDDNGDGFPNGSEATDKTIDRVYTGFLQLQKQSQVLAGTGPAVQGSDGILSALPKKPAPGNSIRYEISYKNISEPQSGVGNVTLSADKVVLIEEGNAGANNWAKDNDSDGKLDTSHSFSIAVSSNVTMQYFSGSPATNLLGGEQSGTTPATDVTKYVLSQTGVISPGVTLTFSFTRSVNNTLAGTSIDNEVKATYEAPDNPGTIINTTSNKVSVTIPEVAGLRIAAGTLIDNNGGSVQPGDRLLFPFTITNAGNDPTRVQLPAQAGITGPASVSLLEYSLDNGTSWSAVTAGGFTTPSLSVTGSVLMRVVVNVNSGATPQQVIKVVLGETNPAETTANAGRAGSVNDSRDVYTVDNPDGAEPGEVTGTPVNGVVEVSTSLSVAVGPREYALATLLTIRTAYNNNNTGNDITDDQLTYSLGLRVESTDPTGLSITATDMAGTGIPGISGNNILVSFAIPNGTSLASLPTAPTGWACVYTTAPVSTAANAATWTTSAPGSLSTITRVGFAKVTVDGNASTYLAAQSNQTTTFPVTIKIQSGQTAPLTVAALGQVFGKTPGTNAPVMDESGDTNPGNFDGPLNNMTPPAGTDLNGNGVPDQLPATVPDGFINDAADLTATGTDTNGDNGGDLNNPAANAQGEANVFTINSLNISLSGTVAICAGQPASFTPAITGGNAPYSLTLSDGTATTVLSNYTIGQGIIVSPAISRTYTIAGMTDANGTFTTGSGSVVVTINPSNAASIRDLTYQPDGSTPCRGKLTAIASGASFVVKGPNSYAFTNVYRSSGSDVSLLFPEIKETGTYILRVTDGAGCATVTRSITIQDLCTKQ
ncbi:hypothetical protein BLX24_21080 [Arsenicibacter rosenii]|uniref:DUF7925 domain-containing protein n=2 Tax=Arsenicibacter rosenii TaxID=1750698 RepID=A0A1S2VH87_9BACT|nr:hypothetical protein BLX24_21080 [Arsenicibacter rosenii]